MVVTEYVLECLLRESFIFSLLTEIKWKALHSCPQGALGTIICFRGLTCHPLAYEYLIMRSLSESHCAELFRASNWMSCVEAIILAQFKLAPLLSH